MKKKLTSLILTAIFGLFAGFTAYAAIGDIYSITRCDEFGNDLSEPFATAADPAWAGTNCYFKVRLQTRDNIPEDLVGSKWHRVYTGIGEPVYALPPQIGIYVSGERVWADWIGEKAEGSYCTAVIFKYTTKPGDFAMPIRLATASGPAGDKLSSNAYVFNPLRQWQYEYSPIYFEGSELVTNTPVQCNWFFRDYSQLLPEDSFNATQDYSLKECGFYVKTIDFSADWESTDFWRTVHEGSDITGDGSTPKLVIDAASEDERTLYVWSDDESAVIVKDGTPTTMQVSGNPVTTGEFHVRAVTFKGGQIIPSEFQIVGADGGEGKTANLILSAYDHFNYSLANPGERIIDYIVVPVKCIEPLPPTIYVNVANDPAYAKVGDGWKSYSTTLDVFLSQPLEEDIDVTITPSIAGHDELNMADYVKFSKSLKSVKTIASLEDAVTVKIKAGQTRSADTPVVYVYFLRGDDYTSGGATLDFTPSISAAQQASTGLNTPDRFVSDGCEVIAENPEFVAPEDGSEIGATAGVPMPIEIEIADTYAGQQLASPDDGYKIEVKYNDATGWKELAGAYYIGAGNLLRKSDGKLPELNYATSSASTSTGTFTTQIRVTEPINGNKAVARLVATVAAPKTVSVASDKDSYDEGDTAKFTVNLNADNDTGAPLYAFLVAGPDTVTKGMFKALGRQCVITPDMTDTDYPTTSGLVINPDNGGPEKPVFGNVKLLDGESLDVGGSSFYFTIQLCTTPYYDPNTVVTGYNSNYSTIQVFNVEPTITRVEMNGYEPLDDNYFEGKYPVGQTQTFQAIVKDVGGFDLDNGFHTRWTITRVGGGVQIPVDDIVGNPNDPANSKSVEFLQDGTYKIKVQVKDKDMEDWAELFKEVFVVVVAQPQLELVVPDTPDETENRLKVGVSLGGYYNATVPMVVMLTVEPPASSANPGILTLDGAYESVPAGYETLAAAAIAADGSAGYDHYYIEITGTETRELSVVKLDGTILSLSPGFSIKAQVLNDGISSDPSKTWAEYYLPNREHFYINNLAPVCIVTEPSTGRWDVASGAATSYPIRWTVRSDVDNDYTGLWDDGVTRGIKVSFSGCDNADDGLAYVISRTSGTSGVFVPIFGADSKGPQTVTMTIEDKDGGYTTWTYLYNVIPSKALTTTSVGPAGGSLGLSVAYSEAKGLGEGHVYIGSPATFSKAVSYSIDWTCGSADEVSIFGWGYKVGAVDDGTLNDGRDIAVDQGGNAMAGTPVTPGNAYRYSDSLYDSYLYTYIVSGDGGATLLENTIWPEGSRVRQPGIPLASEQRDDGSYAKTKVDAIFSREKYPLDNCGDINQDGIPDRMLVKYNFGVAFDGVSDLESLAGYNEDQDYLPATSTGGNRLVPNVASEWATKGIAFNAYYEIRGFGKGLNAGYKNPDGSNPAPDYTVNEKRAWLEWKGLEEIATLKGMSDADVNTLFNENIAAATADLALANAGNGGWSPERPTDPTKADTDSDGLEDGYEYWFWYGAKVGYYDKDPKKNGKWQGRMKGRRLNIDDLDNFEEIPSDDICEAFDPTSISDEDSGESIAARDFDGDGLYDLEEYLIGTNPVDCDTDNDGVPDGYEIMWGLNPLDDEDGHGKTSNPDGDFMAYATLDEYSIVEFDADLGAGDNHYIYLAKSFEDDVLEGCLLGIGDYADLVMTLGDDTVPQSLGELETLDLVELGADNITEANANDLSLVHNQVYKFFGYDPRTAWSAYDAQASWEGACTHGYVASRWCPFCNTKRQPVTSDMVGKAGLSVNTRRYTTRDEYLFGKYNGIVSKETVLATLKASCTNPNIAFSGKSYGDSTTAYESTVHGADTDENGVPDGWEAYVGYNPVENPNGLDNSVCYDGDKVALSGEYSCNDGVRVYAACESIANNSSTKSGWFNKFFPTDPNNPDTDGDGIDDLVEGSILETSSGSRTTFIYGSPEDDGKTLCFRGGGTNPCSTDTDLDALPDAWEWQYAGTVVTPEGEVEDQANTANFNYSLALKIADGANVEGFAPKGPYITGGMDATDNGDAYTPMVGGAEGGERSKDEITGTLRDRDFDHDGLDNYKEYLVQAVRCWRYDDAETPLMGRALKWTAGSSSPTLVEADDAFLTFDACSGERMLQSVQSSALWAEYGAAGTYAENLDAYDYKALGYFAPCDHEWDPGYQFNLMDPETNPNGFPNGTLYMKFPQTMVECDADGVAVRAPANAYVSTDPRRWDTDNDGMDDYWEVFHGLNPIIGAMSDVVGSAYPEFNGSKPVSVSDNKWLRASGVDGYDPLYAPWNMGLPEADPDGDGLRNLDEAITGNLTSPTTYHTDPSPLWMTEPSTPASYVSQYYVRPNELAKYPWTLNIIYTFNNVGEDSTVGYLFAFDVTEGYDTDGDWNGDGHEVVRNASAITDPLNSGDPDRRAALYLPGQDACASTTADFGGGYIPQGYDLFRQFTVEAWIKPDEVNRKQTIVERGFAYPASNLVNSDDVWRANFRLEIDANGVVKGVFDNDNAVESGSALSSQSLAAGKVEPGVWTHVAMTFDGMNVCMYLDGHLMNSAISHLIPANGVISVLQEPASTNKYPMSDYITLITGANTVGARRNVVEFDWTGDFSQFTDFFKGYIAEVRFWDGARTANEIASTYKRRMTPDRAAEQRETVYKKWKGDDIEDPATRNDVDGNPDLPAQLITVYNFQQLPAADSKDDVSQYPSGFELGVQANTTLSSDDIKVGWWEDTPLKSTVYKDTRVIPYAHNVLTHLALFDGACEDSMFWSDTWAGYTPAGDNGVKSYAFPNGGNPYKGRRYMTERAIRTSRYARLSSQRSDYSAVASDLLSRAEFQARSEFTGNDDLVPLGGAYARLDADYWDGQGASTVWTDTGSDADGDGLPDWWETLYGLDKNSAEDWAAEVVWPKDSADGMVVPAWEAYLRDIVAGLQPDGQVHAEYKDKADADGDGLIDWWQNLYSLTTGANGDDDGDGLSNYVEYMLTEVFHLKGTDSKRLRFAPNNPYSVNLYVPDYFHRLEELYVGEIFTDHDRIRDEWELKYFTASKYVSPYIYDPDEDEDGDGWSNHAEFMAGTDPSRLTSLGIDGIQMEEYPIPMIELTASYLEGRNIFGVPLVIKAWRDQEMKSIPDAIWTIGNVSSVQVSENGGSNVVSGVKYIGMNPRREMQLHFSPGSVVPGSVQFEFKDLEWTLLDATTGQTYFYDPVTAIWEGNVIDKQDPDDIRRGILVTQNTGDEVGTIDYATGTAQIDFVKLPAQLYIVGNIAGGTGEGNWYSIYDLNKSYVRVKWQSKITTGGAVSTYYLGEADPRASNNNSLGHVKEGLNTFTAFYDFDGNGMYSPGEPFGFVRNVDVGWNYAKASIELTDTSPVAARYDITKGGATGSEGAGGEGESTFATDREALWEASANGIFDLTNGMAAPELSHVRVRVVRFAVNNPTNTVNTEYMATLYDRDLDLTAAGHQVLTEADLMSDPCNAYDIDWAADARNPAQKTLQEAMNYITISNVYYGVFIGNGAISKGAETNNAVLTKLFRRRFFNTRSRPVPVWNTQTINTAAPTFTWRDSDGDATYTAFRIRVIGPNGFDWTSDYQLMPPRDENGIYSWTPQLRIGSVASNSLLEFKNGETYLWGISTYNAKYTADDWVVGGNFIVDVVNGSTDFGTVDVAVRYYGPNSAVGAGRWPIRVQAFKTPDFSGDPVGEGYVSDVSKIASTDAIREANARIFGLKAGTYYIRAFIDTVNDGRLTSWFDAAGRARCWESWGCYCTRNERNGVIMTPKSITVGPNYGSSDLITVFIDDCDVDGDSMPDAWEWSVNASLDTFGVRTIDESKGGLAIKKSLEASIDEDGSYSTGLATLATTNLRSRRVAALILGVDATGSDDAVMSALNSAGGDVTVEPVKVAITAIALDRDAGTVTITADTEGKAQGTSSTVSEIYELPSDGSDLKLTCKVLHCNVIGGEWEVKATKEVSINRTKTDYVFDLGGDVDLSSGFFKVKLEK